MSNTISNTDDVIDSRDVIARIEELESERETFMEPTEDGCTIVDKWEEQYPEEAEELAALQRLQEEAEGYCPDWRHGATLIRDSYFEEYARQLAEDIGAIGRDMQWPACYIDWAAAADALKIDYTSVDFDGIEYWVR